MIANGHETRWLFREPGNHALLPGRDIKSMVLHLQGVAVAFQSRREVPVSPALTCAETQEIQEHCFIKFSAVLLRNRHLSTPLSFLHLMSAVGLLGSWVVFVFRNVSVESATRQKDRMHIGEIVSFCFLRFKENKIHHMLLAGGKLLYTFGQQNSFEYMESRSSTWSNIFLERVKYFLLFGVCFFQNSF